jgi:hypothetical protein
MMKIDINVFDTAERFASDPCGDDGDRPKEHGSFIETRMRSSILASGQRLR